MNKVSYKELYVKENNLIQLSLFDFGRKKQKKTVVEWEDEKGSYSLKCVCDEGVPGSREQDCYTAVMRIWVKQKMPKGGIELNYSDIARELKLKNINHSSVQIKNSLKKLGAARYQFAQCFVKADKKGRKKITTQFSLFDSTSLYEYERGKSKKNSNSLLIFPEIIKCNLEEKYYQCLDMVWYRNLPEGLPRRLYEYLEKRRYHGVNGIFRISEDALCRWLPIRDRNPTNRRKRLKAITKPLIEKGFLKKYEFEDTKKQCVFSYNEGVNETKLSSQQETRCRVNNLEQSSLIVELILWLNTIPNFPRQKINEITCLPSLNKIYPRIKAQYEDRIKNGGCASIDWVCGEFLKNNDSSENSEEKELEELLSRVKLGKISQKLRQKIKKYLSDNGYDYVKWNILYANKNAKQRYSSYLQRALEENWAEDYKEESEIQKKQSDEVQKQEEKKRLEEEAREKAISKLSKLREKFEKEVRKIEESQKAKFMEEAEKSVPKKQMGRSMNVNIEYCKKLLHYLNGKGFNLFTEDIVGDLKFVKKISLI